jgi:hypothetical protein
MLYTIQHSMSENSYPIKRAHYVGTSVVITLDPSHVRRLGIDELTFFVQRPIEDGIVLSLVLILLKVLWRFLYFQLLSISIEQVLLGYIELDNLSYPRLTPLKTIIGK